MFHVSEEGSGREEHVRTYVCTRSGAVHVEYRMGSNVVSEK